GIERSWPAEPPVVEPVRNLSTLAPEPHGPHVAPTVEGEFRPHQVLATGVPATIKLAEGFATLAKYEDGRPAWSEASLKKGRIVYVGHRAGATYTSKNILVSGHRSLWADTG